MAKLTNIGTKKKFSFHKTVIIAFRFLKFKFKETFLLLFIQFIKMYHYMWISKAFKSIGKHHTHKKKILSVKKLNFKTGKS